MTGGAGVVAHYVLFSSFYFCSLLLWSVADGVIANDVLFFFSPVFLSVAGGAGAAQDVR